MTNIIKASDANFETEVQKYEGVCLVDFWAEWCGPCKMLLPIIDKVAEEVSEDVKIVKVNVDECPETAQAFDVMTIPTLIVFKNGQEVERAVGVRPMAKIIEMIENNK